MFFVIPIKKIQFFRLSFRLGRRHWSDSDIIRRVLVDTDSTSSNPHRR